MRFCFSSLTPASVHNYLSSHLKWIFQFTIIAPCVIFPFHFLIPVRSSDVLMVHFDAWMGLKQRIGIGKMVLEIV